MKQLGALLVSDLRALFRFDRIVYARLIRVQQVGQQSSGQMTLGNKLLHLPRDTR